MGIISVQTYFANKKINDYTIRKLRLHGLKEKHFNQKMDKTSNLNRREVEICVINNIKSV
jgi:hypothetical protein